MDRTTRLSKLTEPGWLEDSINVYTEEEIDKYFPKNVAVNENVVEFGIKPTDNDATEESKGVSTPTKNRSH